MCGVASQKCRLHVNGEEVRVYVQVVVFCEILLVYVEGWMTKGKENEEKIEATVRIGYEETVN